MKKHISSFVIILIVSIGGFAQVSDKTVETIKKVYLEIYAQAIACETDDDKGKFGPLFMNTLTINSGNHQWRAVGIYGKTYKFFYTGGDTEASMYPDKLVLVKLDRRESNRTYKEEFLFSKNGTLAYYAQRAENDDQSPESRELYFSNQLAIRIVEDAKTRDRLSFADTKVAKNAIATATAINDLFQRSINR